LKYIFFSVGSISCEARPSWIRNCNEPCCIYGIKTTSMYHKNL